MRILDCTLRDGGYYNDWDFSEVIVNNYLNAISKSGVDYVELGLRSFPKKGFLGPFAYTTETYLNSLELPEGVVYGVMVDAKTILDSQFGIEETIDRLFCCATKSKVGLVRIAAHFHEIEKSANIARKLKGLGYLIGFNMMQAGGKTTQELTEKSALVESWECVDALYFADSLGNMDSKEVIRITEAIRCGWSGEIGIHTHNNMGRALDNCMVALEYGVAWVDATITGMGRGAGNAQTESLLAILAKTNSHLEPTSVYELVIRYFEKMQKEYGWGSNLLYFLGAQHDVHPTYIQNMLSNSHLGKDEVVGALKYLLEKSSTSKYDGKVLEDALSLRGDKKLPSGYDVTALFANKEVLLITNAPTVKAHRRALELYIEKYKPVVISLNISNVINESVIDYVCISHNLKFLAEAECYKSLTKPFILPKHRFSDEELGLFTNNPKSIDYGVEVITGTFNSTATHCSIPFDLTTAYAIALSLQAKAAKITLAGFDGYNSTDIRQSEMVQLFSFLKEKSNAFEKVIAITPTSYPIQVSSVYAHI
ncbi:aldolase catalytic domain-containing protein [Shewanella sp. AS16]|uniref:aldolase catalytic domain-containing protein n=1 Tax=Shewanella sp. AS16 TaxID=2907625 RepID=UPI001F1B3260|nr:aldolase catalytic domain-containing protein [Shewanella sp. AS16]MCE9686983.1 aldolase catalytic domain-containing protein [Shewanella sp. AS16]